VKPLEAYNIDKRLFSLSQSTRLTDGRTEFRQEDRALYRGSRTVKICF